MQCISAAGYRHKEEKTRKTKPNNFMKLKSTLMRSIASFMLLAGVATTTCAADIDYVTISNPSAGNLLNTILSDAKFGGDLSLVTSIKITGRMNGRDMNVFSQLPNIQNVDLSDVTMVTTDNEVPSITGFRDCSNLETVVLSPEIKNVASEAFSNCYNLKSINLENVETLGSNAFYQCRSLEEINLQNVTNISSYGFGYCRNLKNVILGDNLSFIEYNAFIYTALESITIPKSCSLSSNVFSDSQIKELYFYDNSKINSRSFNGMNNLETLYCFDPVPYPGSDDLEISNHATVLQVPEFALSAYSNNPKYYDFNNIVALDYEVEDLLVNGKLEIDTPNGLASPFNMELGVAGSFINNSGKPLNISSFTQKGRYFISTNNSETSSSNYLKSSSYISNANTTATDVTVSLALMNGRGSNVWNFISFPFNVNISDIVPSENALWVIREYDGAARAATPYDGISKWTNKNTGTLEAGKGYIISLVSDNYDEYEYNNGSYYLNYFSFPAVDDAKKNNIFAYDDVKVNLNYYDSEFDHNKSWNLIGNPFDSYYNISGIEYSNASGVKRVPITVWRRISGSYTYEAFSADDDFTLLPFESFFVQAIDEDNLEMLFRADGRIYSEISTRALTRSADEMEGSDRNLFNIYLTSENMQDRTRLVINNNASVDYEIVCDASKFLSPDLETAQIYMLEKNEMFAINERPFGEGVYDLGVRIGKEGRYTISCDTRNNGGYELFLLDTLTGKETSLLEGDYTFDAATGSDSRFKLKLVGSTNGSGDTAGIETVDATQPNITINGNNLSVEANGEINVYTVDGKLAASGNDTLNVTLSKGLYIIKAGDNSVKAVIR